MRLPQAKICLPEYVVSFSSCCTWTFNICYIDWCREFWDPSTSCYIIDQCMEFWDPTMTQIFASSSTANLRIWPQAKSMYAILLSFVSPHCTSTYTWWVSLYSSLSSTCHCPILGLCLLIGLFFCLKLYSKFQDLPQAKSMFPRIIFLIYPCCTWTYTICIPILVGRSETLLSLKTKIYLLVLELELFLAAKHLIDLFFHSLIHSLTES